MEDLILEKLDEKRRVATEAFANSEEENTVREFILDLLKELDAKDVPYDGGDGISDEVANRTPLDYIMLGSDIRSGNNLTFLEAYIGSLEDGKYWNESISDLVSLFYSLISNTYIPQEADDKTIDYSKSQGDIPSHFVKYYNGIPYNITFDSSDVKNADAGANFVNEDQVTTLRNGKNYVTNPWVRPWNNIDGETYRTVRGEDKIESVLNNPKNLQFTREGYKDEFQSYWPDLYNNDIIDTADAASLLSYLSSKTYEKNPDGSEMTEEQKQEFLKKADADRNGNIDIRDSSLILKFISASGAGQYGNTEEDWEQFLKDEGIFSLNKIEFNKYLRLIMPMYLRNVEIEDLNRNFWVIGQTCAAIATFLFDPNGPLNSLLRGILDELIQLWDNIYMLNLGINEQYYEKQHAFFRYCEVIPVNKTDWSKFNKYDNFDFDIAVDKIKKAVRDTFNKENSGDSAGYQTLENADESIKELFNYVSYQLKVYDSPSFLFIIPELRVNNYKRNYYSEIYIPCFFKYQKNENVGGWTYNIIDLSVKIGENKQVEKDVESDTGKLVVSTTRAYGFSPEEETKYNEVKETYDIYGIREKNNDLYSYVTNLSEYAKTLSVDKDDYTGLIGVHYNFSPHSKSTVDDSYLNFEITFYDIAKFVVNSNNYVFQTINEQQKPNTMKEDFIIDKKYFSVSPINQYSGGGAVWEFENLINNKEKISEPLSINETPIIKGYYQGDLISCNLTPEPLEVDIGVGEIWTIPCIYSNDESHRQIDLFTQLNGKQTFNPENIYNNQYLDFDVDMLSFSGDNTEDSQHKYLQTKYNDFNGKTCSEITEKVLEYESKKICNEIKEKGDKDKLVIALVTAQHVNSFQDNDGRNNGVINFYKPDEEKRENIEFRIENSPYHNLYAYSGGAYINLDDGDATEEGQEKGMYYKDYKSHPNPPMIDYIYKWNMYRLPFSTDGSQKTEFQNYCESTTDRSYETYQEEHNCSIYGKFNGGLTQSYFEIMIKPNGNDNKLNLTGDNKNWLITRIERGVQDTNTWTIDVNGKQERTYLEKYCYNFSSGKIWQQTYSERNSLLLPETFQRQKDLFDQMDNEQEDTKKFGEHVGKSKDIIKKRHKDFGNEDDYKNLTINNLSVKEKGVEVDYWQKNPYVLIRDIQDNNVTITEDGQDIKKRIEDNYYKSGFDLLTQLLNNTNIKTLEDYKKAHKDWPWCEVDNQGERKEKLRRIYAGDHSKKFMVGNIVNYVRIDVFTNDGKTAQRFYYRDLQSIIDYYKNGQQYDEDNKSPWQNQWKYVDYTADGKDGKKLTVDDLREGYKMYNRVNMSGRKVPDNENYEKFKSGTTEDFYDDGTFPADYDKRNYFDITKGGED